MRDDDDRHAGEAARETSNLGLPALALVWLALVSHWPSHKRRT